MKAPLQAKFQVTYFLVALQGLLSELFVKQKKMEKSFFGRLEWFAQRGKWRFDIPMFHVRNSTFPNANTFIFCMPRITFCKKNEKR